MKIISFEEFAEKLKIKPVNVNELKPTDDKSDGSYNGVVFSNIDINPYFYKAGSSMLFEEGCTPVTMNASYNEKEFGVSMVILDEPVIVDPSTGIKYTDASEKLKIRPVSPKNLTITNSDGKLIYNVVSDIDGNSYNGVSINGRIWLESNLRTKHFNDGSDIYTFDVSNKGKLPYYACPDVAIPFRDYCGLYYNFHAVETGMLAPKGWHVPTIEDWIDLFRYVASKEEFNLNPDKKFPFGDSIIAKAVCSKVGWRQHKDDFVVGNDSQTNNSTNFSILPTGFFDTHDGTSNCIGSRAVYWSSSVVKNHTNDGEYISIVYNTPCVYCPTHDPSYPYDGNKNFGFCVRCVKD